MRTVTLLVILVLLPLVSPALSQVPDDKLIVPGQRIGAWALQMTVDDIVGLLGSQTRILPGTQLAADLQIELRAYSWERIGLYVCTRDGRSIVMLAISSAPGFVTEKGVKLDTPRADVETAYGRPTRVTQWGRDPAQVQLQYNEIGLSVFLTQTSTVLGMTVFRPGTASTIWKP